MKAIYSFFFLSLFYFTGYSQTLNNVSPNSGQQGQTLNVTISGMNTHFSQASNTTVWFKQGSATILNAFPISITSNTTIVASVPISNQQPIGLYNLYVNNNIDGLMTKTNAFTVLSNPNQASITSVNPTFATRGQTLNVSISGSNTHFMQATSTTVYFKQGTSTTLYPTSVNRLSNTSIIANMQISNQQPTGLYHLYVNNSIDGSLSKLNSFTILSSSIIGTLTCPVLDTCLNFTPQHYYISHIQLVNNTTIIVSWTFENGSSQQTINVQYSFSNFGNYAITLTINCTGGKELEVYQSYININQSLSIENNNNISSFEIYPNPASSYLYVDNKNSNNKPIDLKIFDIMGNMVLNMNTLNEFPTKINIENFKNGIYFINLKQEDGQVIIKKIIISR